MFELYVENEKDEKLNFSQNQRNYDVLEVMGLSPPATSVNISETNGIDGGKYNSAKIQTRNLVITLKINGDIEKNRSELYRFFGIKQPIKVFYKNGIRNVCIEGYVESHENNPFSNDVQSQISILCPQPFWEDAEEFLNDISQIVSNFEFPFAIEYQGQEISTYNKHRLAAVENNGDTETGFVMKLNALGTVVHPQIYNNDTREFIGVNLTMQYGDLITIDTNPGQKGITLLRGGATSNVINLIDKGITWPILRRGLNTFVCICEDGAEYLNVQITATNKYSGV